MNHLVSFSEQIKQILTKIVSLDSLHAQWLNTLSYLENCGARKIAACEHPTQVKEEMLKHAAEEFRHAHHLKRQIKRVSINYFNDYSHDSLIGGTYSKNYLSFLDLKVCQYLSKTIGLPKKAVKEAAYLLVTYAIELRAEELYPIYDQVLREAGSKVAVKSILLEEKEHLEEMREELSRLEFGFLYAQQVSRFEAELCERWLYAIEQKLK